MELKITNKIEVKKITIYNNNNMIDWKVNELYPGGAGFRPIKSAWNAPSGSTSRACTYLGKHRGLHCPHQLTSSSFLSPFPYWAGKSEQVVGELPTYLNPVQTGHVTVIGGGSTTSTPWVQYRIERTLINDLYIYI